MRQLDSSNDRFGASVPAAAYYAKGNYFTLAGRSPFERLIYPVPEAAGLGVHLTLDLGGQAKFGPDVQWVNAPDDLLVDATRGMRFMPRFANTGRHCLTARCKRVTPAFAPKSAGRMRRLPIFSFKGPKPMAWQVWSIYWALNRRG